MAETIKYADALARINTWRERNDCTALRRVPNLSSHCEECGFRYEPADLRGGRCGHCNTMICAPPMVIDAPDPEPTQRVYIVSWAPSYDEASSGGHEWCREWGDVLDLLRDDVFVTPGHDYRVTTLDLPATMDDEAITDFLGGRGTEVIDPPDPRDDLADALADYLDDEE